MDLFGSENNLNLNILTDDNFSVNINNQTTLNDKIYGIDKNVESEIERQKAIEKSKASREIKSEIPYVLYENKHPFLRQYDEDYYQLTQFNKWTETRYFTPDMLQECIANEFSDEQWDLSLANKISLTEDLKKAMDTKNTDF